MSHDLFVYFMNKCKQNKTSTWKMTLFKAINPTHIFYRCLVILEESKCV